MHGVYCPLCNTFLYTNSAAHYCRVCRGRLIDIAMDYSEFSELSANERYRLAYKLTQQSKKE